MTVDAHGVRTTAVTEVVATGWQLRMARLERANDRVLAVAGLGAGRTTGLLIAAAEWAAAGHRAILLRKNRQDVRDSPWSLAAATDKLYLHLGWEHGIDNVWRDPVGGGSVTIDDARRITENNLNRYEFVGVDDAHQFTNGEFSNLSSQCREPLLIVTTTPHDLAVNVHRYNGFSIFTPELLPNPATP